MAWRRPCDKPLSEPMMVRLPTHICVTRPQWVKGRFANQCVSLHGIRNHWYPVWIHDKTFNQHEASQRLVTTIFAFRTIWSPWNVTCDLPVLLPRRLGNFKAMRQFKLPISHLSYFTNSEDETSLSILQKVPPGTQMRYIGQLKKTPITGCSLLAYCCRKRSRHSGFRRRKCFDIISGCLSVTNQS